MPATSAQKAQTIQDYQRIKGDTGSPEVQVALLTSRINELTGSCQGSPFPSRFAPDGKPEAQDA